MLLVSDLEVKSAPALCTFHSHRRDFLGNWPPAEITFSITFFFPGLIKFSAKGQSTACLILSSDTFFQGVLPAYVRRDPLNCAESS